MGISKQTHQINDDIRDREVRLIDAQGNQMGVVDTRDAKRMAMDADLDLVKIAPAASPPVCRIMDYGKFRFEQSKKEKEARKNQHVVELKEIRLSMGIDIHDFNFKLKNALKFLKEGNKVKVSIRFRGREMAHTSLGQQQMVKFADSCGDAAVVERPPKLEGRSMSMFLAPVKAVVKPEQKGEQKNQPQSAAAPSVGVPSVAGQKPEEQPQAAPKPAAKKPPPKAAAKPAEQKQPQRKEEQSDA